MIARTKRFLLLFLTLCFLAGLSWAQQQSATKVLSITVNPAGNGSTITAASCSASDVQAAINVSVNGDTVLLPPNGACTWSPGNGFNNIGTVNISSSHQITINGQGTTISFAGDDTDPGFDNTVFSTTAGSSFNTIIENFTFVGAYINGRFPITISSTSGNLPWRFTNNTVTSSVGNQQATNLGIYSCGNTPGLVDHNTFTTTHNFQEIIHNFGCSSQTSDWSSDIIPGGLNYIYVETNVFTGPCCNSSSGTMAIENFLGARIVFRYNTMNNTGFDAHGYSLNIEPPTEPNSCDYINTRWVELYNNNLNFTGSNTNFSPNFVQRGGSGVIFNNTKTGTNLGSTAIQFQADCTDTGGHPYPYQDQDGRGITTSSGSSTTHLSPIYLWNNPAFGVSVYQGSSYVQSGRDYFTSSSQPATLTRCESAADVTAGCPVSYSYSPAVYPYPFSGGGGGGGTIITASSCSLTDVQSAITTAPNGATVQIPGPCTTNWSSFANIPNTKGITVKPTGGTVTIGTSSEGFSLNASTTTTRITGFTCNRFGNYPTDFNGHCLQVNTSPGMATYRIDHWTMCSGGGSCTTPQTIFVSINGIGPGLFDHDTLLFNGSAAIQMNGIGIACNYTTGSNGCGWNTDVVPGGPNMTFFEDDTFTNTGCATAGCSAFGNGFLQGYGGTITVVRYSTITVNALDQHGSQGGGNEPVGPQCPGGGSACEGSVGVRWFEIYNDSFVNLAGGDSLFLYMDLRAGSGVVFNNTVSGLNTSSGYLRLREENSCPWPNGFQVGAGINGFTTNPSCSSHYATCGALNTAPVYMWNNAPGLHLNTGGTVQQGRDFFSSATQPASMHWMEKAGDNCSTTYNYTPYQYPHPLNH